MSRFSRTRDFFNEITGSAISAKTLDTTTYTYSRNVGKIFSKLAKYIDAASNYNIKRTVYDLDPALIKDRQIQLAIPYDTTPAQMRQIYRAISYATSKNIHLEVTRIE